MHNDNPNRPLPNGIRRHQHRVVPSNATAEELKKALAEAKRRQQLSRLTSGPWHLKLQTGEPPKPPVQKAKANGLQASASRSIAELDQDYARMWTALRKRRLAAAEARRQALVAGAGKLKEAGHLTPNVERLYAMWIRSNPPRS